MSASLNDLDDCLDGILSMISQAAAEAFESEADDAAPPPSSSSQLDSAQKTLAAVLQRNKLLAWLPLLQEGGIQTVADLAQASPGLLTDTLGCNDTVCLGLEAYAYARVVCGF